MSIARDDIDRIRITGAAPEPDLRAVNAALVAALQGLLRPDGHTVPCGYDEPFGTLHCTDLGCRQARVALKLATGGQP